MNPTPYTFLDLLTYLPAVPEDGILSQVLHNDDRVRAVVFGFAAGQSLSDHAVSTPAIVHIVRGQARLVVGGDAREAGPGAWAFMPANLSHSLTATTELVMLLLLLKDSVSPKESQEGGR